MTDSTDLGTTVFVRLLQVVAWALASLFTALSLALTVYQLFALYLPYMVARLTQNENYKLPAYMHKVWGDIQNENNQFDTLELEHWSYLILCTVTTLASSLYVVPNIPADVEQMLKGNFMGLAKKKTE